MGGLVRASITNIKAATAHFIPRTDTPHSLCLTSLCPRLADPQQTFRICQEIFNVTARVPCYDGHDELSEAILNCLATRLSSVE